MKKNISVICLFLALILCFSFFVSFSKVEAKAEKEVAQSRSAYLIDSDSKTVIYSKNEEEMLPIASMCKIMTLLIIFEQIDGGNLSLDEEITVSDNASSMGGSQVFLESNYSYKASELVKSIVVASANDACVAMAERISGSQESFVDLMNKRAEELGMEKTVFVNCTGLPCVGQHSTAKDVAIMFGELISHEKYYDYSSIWMDEIHHKDNRITSISNTNKLIRFYQGCDAGKTGYTSEAGHCLCASAKRDNMRLIAVVIKAPNSKSRFLEVSNMFNYGFANYTNKLIVDSEKPLEINVNVKKGKKDSLEVVAEKPLYSFAKKGEKKELNISFSPLENVIAPIKKGDYVGDLTLYENNVEVASVKVLANENVDRATYFDSIKDISKNWGLI